MTERDFDQPDELFAAWLAGDLDAEDPHFVAVRDAVPELGERFVALAAARAQLEQSGRAARELLDESRRLEPSALEELASSTVLRAATACRPEPNLRPLAIAAALLALVLGATWFQSGAPQSDWRFLGSNVEGLVPTGSVERLDRFRWDLDLPAGGTYRLRVWAEEAGARGALLLSTELTEPWYEVAVTTAEEWNAILWEVESVGPLGSVVESDGASAKLD